MTMICGNCGFADASIQGFCKQCGASSGRFVRDSDTRPKDGDAKQAPLASSAGSKSIAQTPPSNKGC